MIWIAAATLWFAAACFVAPIIGRCMKAGHGPDIEPDEHGLECDLTAYVASLNETTNR